jgi:hypothetical protein
MSGIQPLGRSFRLQELIDTYAEWDISVHGFRVTAALRDDPGVQATANPETGKPLPVLVSVMASVLADWRVQQDTAHCRMQRHSRPV